MLVSMAPGQITLTRTFDGASSSAAILVNATCPALLQEYAVAPVLLNTRVPLMDEFTITDPPRLLEVRHGVLHASERCP